MRRFGQLEGISDERALPTVERRSTRFPLQRGEQFFFFSERTERLPVMADSIVAVIDHRDRDGNHLALDPR